MASNESNNEKKEKVIIIKKGPNLFLFSIALLMAIFSSYMVGSLVTKKAESKSNSIDSEKKSDLSPNLQEKNNENIMAGKSYKYEDLSTKKTSYYYFYNDNTYYYQTEAYNEYGTYEYKDDEIILYNIFSYNPGLEEPIIALKGKLIGKMDKTGIKFMIVDEKGEQTEEKFFPDRNDIDGGLSYTMEKIQSEINNKNYCE